MKAVPHITLWAKVTEVLDLHFGHRPDMTDLTGPCVQGLLYLVESLQKGQLQIHEVEAALSAWRLVAIATSRERFIPNPRINDDAGFVLWRATIMPKDDAWMDRHCHYFTNRIRSEYISACFTTAEIGLVQHNPRQSHEELLSLRDAHESMSMGWAALKASHQLYGDLLVHLAYRHQPTRERIERDLVSTMDALELRDQAKVDAREAFTHLSRAFYDEFVPSPKKSGTVFRIIPGGKR